MADRRWRRGLGLVILVASIGVSPSFAADLYAPAARGARPHILRYRPIGPPPDAQPLYPADTPPASSHGYYGYYGVDIFGVPYEGLYSAEVLCLHSVRTPEGYRTVDVCRNH